MTYIFVTDAIQRIGGIECYISAKKRFLERKGWQVYIIFSPTSFRKPVIENLRDSIGFLPIGMDPFRINRETRNKLLDTLLEKLSLTTGDIIIDSHNDKAAPWGELIAEKLKCKHIILLLDEIKFGKGIYYKDYVEFYSFKFDRKELSGRKNVKLILDGYRSIRDDDCVICSIEEDSVQDCNEKRLGIFPICDWTIAYIGRTNKSYFPYILKDVATFSKLHSDKKICYVIVGKTNGIRGLVRSTFSGCQNVTVKYLGEVYPIPRKLFPHLDVVIAGSGSARASAMENTITIAADIYTNKAIGVLGYTTNSSIWADPNLQETTFYEALNYILIEKGIDGLPFTFKSRTMQECYDQNMNFLENTCSVKDYYRFENEERTIKKTAKANLTAALYLASPKFVVLLRGIKMLIKRIVRRG